MTEDPRTLYLIDDDPSVLAALCRLLRSSGNDCKPFPDAESFLASDPDPQTACIISDIRMPGVSGLEIPSRLAALGLTIPIIFLTAYDSPEIRAQAQSAGASAYFRKPVDEHALLDAIAWAMSHPTA